MDTSVRAPATSRRSGAWTAGARAMTPFAVAVAPFGAVIGATVAGARISPVLGLSTGPLLYGGSAQLTTITLLSSGASALAVVAAVAVVNSRLALYSAALAPTVRDQPNWFRWTAAYLLVDPQFAVVSAGVGGDDPPEWRRGFYLGAAATLWGAWHASILAGYVGGPLVPTAWHVELVVPLYLTLIVARRVTSTRSAAAVLTAAVVAFVCAGWPSGTGLLAGIVAGLTVMWWRP